MALRSSCINHPSIEAVGRCKQCGKPYCSTCQTTGPTGHFCSGECKQGHESYVDRARKLDVAQRGGGFFAKFGRLIKKVLVFGVVILIICVVLILFFGVNIPFLSDWINRFR